MILKFSIYFETFRYFCCFTGETNCFISIISPKETNVITNTMKRFLLPLVFLLLISEFTFGQLKFSEGEVLVLSRHIWRGSQLGNDIAIEPSLTVESGNFSFNFWAAVTPNNSYSEIDLIPSYAFKHFSVSLLNYYNPVPDEKNSYFNLKEGESRHSLELTVDNYSLDDYRFKWMIGTFLLGDKSEETGKPLYSTYCEFMYPFTVKGIDIEPFAGFTTHAGLYAENFAFVNTGVNVSKEIELKLPFTIPLSLSFITNPYAKQSFIVFSGGIAF